jgi:hypothetical protein
MAGTPAVLVDVDLDDVWALLALPDPNPDPEVVLPVPVIVVSPGRALLDTKLVVASTAVAAPEEEPVVEAAAELGAALKPTAFSVIMTGIYGWSVPVKVSVTASELPHDAIQTAEVVPAREQSI